MQRVKERILVFPKLGSQWEHPLPLCLSFERIDQQDQRNIRESVRYEAHFRELRGSSHSLDEILS